MSYTPHSSFVSPARAKPEVWRVLLGCVLVMAVTFGLGQAVAALAMAILGNEAGRDFFASVASGRTAGGALMLLLLTGSLGVGAAVAAQLCHHRGFLSLIGAPRRAVGQFFAVTVALIVLQGVVLALPPYGVLEVTRSDMAVGTWVGLLPVMLIVLLIQTGSEEVLFRGYLQQQCAARFDSPWVWITVPSALFALAHYSPGVYGENTWFVVLWAFAFGVMTADLTARSGTLGPAIAVHFVNNLQAIAIVALQGDLSGLALYVLPFAGDDTGALRQGLPIDLAMMLLGWLAARLVLRR